MQKLISRRIILLIVGVVLTAISLAIHMIWGNDPNKISVAVMMLVYPLVTFAFLRFVLYMWTKKKLYRTVKFFSWFLFGGGAFFTIGGFVMLVMKFPNTAVPPVSVGMSMILCVLYSNANPTEKSAT